MLRRTFGFVAAALVAALPAARSFGQVARLELQSAPGDYIGGGGTFDTTYTRPPDDLSAQVRRALPDGRPAELLWVLDSDRPGNQFALVFFGTDALGTPIQPGVYTGAQRADFAAPGHPGMDISFQNRGCNTLTGSFTIDYVTFGASPNDIRSFRATFEQHCEGMVAPLVGTFTYNAVPEPSALGMALLAAVPLLRRRGRRT